MFVCISLVSFVVFDCLYFVGRASFVRVLMITTSLFLYVVCLMLFRVCGRVYVGCRLIL